MSGSPEGLIGAVEAIRSGELTAAAAAAATIRRVEELDSELGAVCAVCPEPQLERELATVAGGELAGVPVAVKDQFALRWWAARDGTPVAAPMATSGESAVSRRLRAAGALPLLVTNMHQLGLGISGEISARGRTANPWDRCRWAGGSSGGSAAAVAAGYVGLAVGSDGAGSIRIPAAWCGVTGLKPTWGAVSAEGYTSVGSSMTAIGPIGRDAADCRVGAEALTGRTLAAELPRPLRIGVLRGAHWENFTAPVQQRFEAALELLERDGAEVRPVAVRGSEHIPIAALVILGIDRLGQITPTWMRDVFPRLERPIRTLLKSRYRLPIDAVARAMRLRGLLRAELARLFATVDLIAAPTVPAGAPRSEDPRLDLPHGRASADLPTMQLNALANLTGVPAITTPIGGDEDGMPLGMTLHAAWGQEPLALAAAEQFERLSERRHLCPPQLPSDPTEKGLRPFP